MGKCHRIYVWFNMLSHVEQFSFSDLFYEIRQTQHLDVVWYLRTWEIYHQSTNKLTRYQNEYINSDWNLSLFQLHHADLPAVPDQGAGG